MPPWTPDQADDILAAKPEQHHTIPCDGLFKKGGALDNVVPADFDHSRVECGLFTVPLDWARPYKHKRTQLHYVKYRAASGAVREGTIFVSLRTHADVPAWKAPARADVLRLSLPPDVLEARARLRARLTGGVHSAEAAQRLRRQIRPRLLDSARLPWACEHHDVSLWSTVPLLSSPARLGSAFTHY